MNFYNFTDPQFVDAVALNAAMSLLQGDFNLIGSSLHTPGVVNASALGFSPSLLVLTVTAPSPFACLFGNGSLQNAYGTVNGQSTSTYIINCASFVPGSGSQTVYIVAAAGTIQQNFTPLPGPPPGHPDYTPTYNPFYAYLENQDSLNIFATTTAPNNTTNIELCRFTLTAGQTSITGISTAFQQRAGAILSQNGEVLTADLQPTGVTAGAYNRANVTVGVDGRITAIAQTNPINGTATWTTPGTYNFTVPANVYQILMYVTGGGGGGADASSNTYTGFFSGGGGGAGGTGIGVYSVTPGQVISITVAAGGTAQSPGGTSIVSGFLQATGGGGSSYNSPGNSAGAPGGTATGGNIANLPGGSGSDGSNSASPYLVFAGNGGVSFWGGGGRAAAGGGNVPVQQGQAPGSGAGGAYNSTSTVPGGSGAPGIVVFIY